MRIAHIYALLDQSPQIRVDHLEAALAVWDYCLSSVRSVFSQSLGNPTADTILEELKKATTLTRSEIRSYVGGRADASKIKTALALLERYGLAHMRKDDTGGRPAEVWVYGKEKSEETEETPCAVTVEQTEETETAYVDQLADDEAARLEEQAA
jgi:hypothetical protein